MDERTRLQKSIQANEELQRVIQIQLERLDHIAVRSISFFLSFFSRSTERRRLRSLTYIPPPPPPPLFRTY